jgi:putative alpha-1,2-mannosidase
MRKLYSAAPDGYCGDEDNGQTSAWYVFSAMGFYPVCPGSNEYALGSPLFRRMTIRPLDGKAITITSDGGDGADAPYISSMSVNGASLSRNYLTHEELAAGARVDYKMSSEPNTSRGTSEEDFPYSFSRQ